MNRPAQNSVVDKEGPKLPADGSPNSDSQTTDNLIKQAIADLTDLQASMEEIRTELRARGVQSQSTNVMVEMAFHNRQDEMQGLIEAALNASQQAYGHGAISRDELQQSLDSLLALEKDVAYTRKLCRQRGLDLQVINVLTQIIRQNPGDGGQQSINAFLGYAQACDIELSGIEAIAQKFTSEPESVLPNIKRPGKRESRWLSIEFLRDILIGLAITLILMSLIV